MSERQVVLLLLALLAAPTVLAHAGEQEASGSLGGSSRAPHADIPEGYTGPSRDAYRSFFEGVWLYGQVSATAINEQRPVDLDADGDWVVWEDSRRGDIFAFSISAGHGFYITTDGLDVWQRDPAISGNVIVYEDHRQIARPAIYAYFLDTGETRRLTENGRATRDPVIDYPIVAWVDENSTSPDIWSYSLLNNTGWNVNPGTDRDSEPVVVDDYIYWRTYRYNLFDMVGYDTRAEEPIQVTGSSALESTPFSNGEDLLYLTRAASGGWHVDRYDHDTERTTRAKFFVSDTSKNSASGDALLRVAMELDYSQLVVRNLTSGAANHVSGNLLLQTSPIIMGRTIFACVQTQDGTSLIQLQVSPFALATPPVLTVVTPSGYAPWTRPTVVSGLLQAGPEFTEPSTFTYRLDDEPPQIIPVAERWRFTLDPNGVASGSHTVTIRATFREGPPVTTSITLTVPPPGSSIDVSRAGPAFHAARVAREMNNYFLDNPASWVLLPLVVILLAVVAFRLWLWIKPKRRVVLAEYVNPDVD